MKLQLPAYLPTQFPQLRVNYMMNRVSSPGAPSIDRFQVVIQSRLIMASKCISKLARSRPPSSHDLGLQVHLQTRSITACKFTRSWPPSASPNSLDYSLQVSTIMVSKWHNSKLAHSRPRSVSPNWLDYGLQVRTSMASKCIFKLAPSRPPSASLSSLDLSLQVHIQTRSITASKCITEFTRSTSPSASQTRSIKYIFKERQRLYGDTGVTEVDRVTGSIRSRPRSISLSSLDPHFQAHLALLSSTGCSQSRYSVCRWVAI